MPTDVLEVTKKFMREPIRILVKKEELTLEGIKQFYINVEREVGRLLPAAIDFEKAPSLLKHPAQTAEAEPPGARPMWACKHGYIGGRRLKPQFRK